jgi:hypothetical protein
MLRSVIPALLALLVSVTGCAALPEFQDDPKKALQREESAGQAPADLIYGQTAATRGDWDVALAFFERSYREKPSILNEFNLATAYQRTGQGALAVPLYLDLIDRGRLTEVTPVQNSNGTFDQKQPASDIADEARERLIKMHATSLRSDRGGAAQSGQ